MAAWCVIQEQAKLFTSSLETVDTLEARSNDQLIHCSCNVTVYIDHTVSKSIRGRLHDVYISLPQPERSNDLRRCMYVSAVSGENYD